MKIRLDPVRDFSDETLDKIAIPQRDKVAQAILNIHMNVDDPIVIGIDGDWGAGKTVFLHRLSQMARSKSINVCYFNAFETDVSKDAFVSITSSLSSFIVEKYGEREQAEFLKAASKVGSILALGLGRKFLTKVTGGIVDEELQLDIQSAFKNDGDKSLIQDIIKASDRRVEAIKSLHTIMNSLNEEVDGNSGFVYIIDELDRCRPDYALDVLECIKHIYSSPSLSIIIGANFRELGKAFSHRYGVSADSGVYFDKFLDVRHKLTGRFDDGTSGHRLVLRNIIGDLSNDSHRLRHITLEHIADLFSHREYSIRSWIKLLEAYNYASIQMPDYNPELSSALALASTLKTMDYNVYQKWINGIDCTQEIIDFFTYEAAFDANYHGRENPQKLLSLVQSQLLGEPSEANYMRRAARDLLELGGIDSA